MALDNLDGQFTVVLGGPFLKKFYSIYDVDNYKIGFALAALVPYLILEMVWGFDISLGTSNTEESKMGIFYLYIFVPIIGYAIAAFLLFTHTFGRQEHADVESTLRDT